MMNANVLDPVSQLPTTTVPSLAPSAVPGRGSDFAALSRLVRDAGLLERRPGRYAARIVVTLAGYAAVWGLIGWLGKSWWQALTAAALAVATTQVTFLAHDAGHLQIFTTRRANDRFGRLISVLTGLSFGWWIGKHVRHHANPNKEGHDPDIGDGVFAFTTNQVAARTGRVGRAVVAWQAWLFFPLLTLEGYNLRLASLLSLRPGGQRSPRGGNRAVELVIWTVHVAIYAAAVLMIMSPGQATVFVLVHQGLWGFYMGCSFAPNHKGMPCIPADQEVDFLRRQVLTSRNVRGGVLTDLLLGGLNYQIEHHLFPSLPRASQRRAQRLIQPWCQAHDVSYSQTTLLGSYVAAVSHLHQLGAPLRRPNPVTAAGTG